MANSDKEHILALYKGFLVKRNLQHSWFVALNSDNTSQQDGDYTDHKLSSTTNSNLLKHKKQ